MVRDAPRAIYELEHMGVPFSRTPDRIDRPEEFRRPYAGVRKEAGEEGMPRRGPHGKGRPRHAPRPVPPPRRQILSGALRPLPRLRRGAVHGGGRLRPRHGGALFPSGQRPSFLPRAGAARSTGRPRTGSPPPARYSTSPTSRASPWRTWSSSSSTPRGSTPSAS